MTGVNHYSRLLRYVRPYRWAFGVAVLGMMIVAAGDLMLAWLVIPIVRNFESPDPTGTRCPQTAAASSSSTFGSLLPCTQRVSLAPAQTASTSSD